AAREIIVEVVPATRVERAGIAKGVVRRDRDEHRQRHERRIAIPDRRITETVVERALSERAIAPAAVPRVERTRGRVLRERHGIRFAIRSSEQRCELVNGWSRIVQIPLISKLERIPPAVGLESVERQGPPARDDERVSELAVVRVDRAGSLIEAGLLHAEAILLREPGEELRRAI